MWAYGLRPFITDLSLGPKRPLAYLDAMGMLVQNIVRYLCVALVAVALGGVGFAHRHSDPVDADMAAFLAIGGTLADICDSDAGSQDTIVSDCEACRLVSAASLSRGVATVGLFEPAAHETLIVRPFDQCTSLSTARVSMARAPPTTIV